MTALKRTNEPTEGLRLRCVNIYTSGKVDSVDYNSHEERKKYVVFSRHSAAARRRFAYG